MEAGGFRVKLDLSHFLNGVKKLSCIYVDLSRDRQIVDVTDRISALFGIEGPLCLLDENFYLPESENVNVLRGSTIIKVTKSLHSWDKNSVATDILGQSVSAEEKYNPAETSGNRECAEFQHGNAVNNSSVVHKCEGESRHKKSKKSKKRKKEECESSDIGVAKNEHLHENFESDVTKSLHSWDKNSVATDILGQSFSAEEKHNPAETSGNIDCAEFQQGNAVNNSSVVHQCEGESHHNKIKKSKKRKKEECESSDIEVAKDEPLYENFEYDVYYQKKCKRKKEKIRKDVNDSYLKQDDGGGDHDEVEGIVTYDTNLERDHKQQKYRKKVKSIELDDFEQMMNYQSRKDNYSVNESVQNEIAIEDMNDICKHKKELDQFESLYVSKKDSALLTTRNEGESSSMVSAANYCKKDRKEVMIKEPSFHPNTEDCNISWVASYSEVIPKFRSGGQIENKNNNNTDHNFPINNDSVKYLQPDFVDNTVSNTSKGTTDSKKTEDPIKLGNSEPVNFPNNDDNSNIFVKSKRKRVRTRRRKNKLAERNIIPLMNYIQPQSFIPTSLKRVPSPQRTHIRFNEEENLETKEVEDSNQQKTLLSNDTCCENDVCENMSNIEKVSPTVNIESANVGNEQEQVTDSKENLTSETTINLAYSHPSTKCSEYISSTSLTTVPSSHPHWVTTYSDLNSDSQETLQKLLSLGKQNSSPVVFERKRQTDSYSHELEQSTTVEKENKPAIIKNEVVNGITEESIKEEPATINPLNYPLLQGAPKTKDIIAFKVLTMTNNYTPKVSDFIIATVLQFCDTTSKVLLKIQVGDKNLQTPKGRFYFETDDSGKNEEDLKLVERDWNELMEVRILFP